MDERLAPGGPMLISATQDRWRLRLSRRPVVSVWRLWQKQPSLWVEAWPSAGCIDCMAVYRALAHWGSGDQPIMREDPQGRPVQVFTKGLANAKV